MTGFAVLAVLVVAGLGFAWTRMTTSRAERRSVDAYERQLDVLGHVAQRSDASAVIHKPTAKELARPHVLPSQSEGAFLPSKTEYRPVAPPRVRLEPPVPPAQNADLPVFGDDVEAITGRPLGRITDESLSKRSRRLSREASRSHTRRPSRRAGAHSSGEASSGDIETLPPLVLQPELFDDVAEPIAIDEVSKLAPKPRAPRSTRPRSIDRVNRRVFTGAAAVVVLGAVAVGGWQLASKENRTPRSSALNSSKSHASKTRTSPFSDLPGSTLQPTTSTSSLVTYPAPNGTYTITFSALSACWVGIQPGSSQTYLAMKTLTSADNWSYQATGTIVIRIGAPKTLSVKINGETVALPSTVQPYDISFVPTGATSA